MPASATPKGVDRRQEALADIVKNRNAALAVEMKEGGSSEEDIAAVTSGTVAAVSDDDPRRPQDIAPEDWSKMSDEEKGNEIASAAAAIAGETDEQKAERERLATEAAAKAEEERKAAEAAGAKKVKGKIDGKEVEFDESAVMEAGLRTLQKESTADKRLEEATKARDEAERLRKRVEDTLAAGGQPAAEKAKTDQEMIVAKEGLRDIVKKIQYGSEDEAAQALVEYGNKMASLGQAGRLTETELHNILDLREAQNSVKTEFADVMADPNLKELFVVKVNRKLAAGDGRPYQEICKETGDELRTWKAPAKADPTGAAAAAAAAAAAGGSRAAAQTRKVNTLSIPAAAARQQAASSEPKAPPSNAELVEQARKARGQA